MKPTPKQAKALELIRNGKTPRAAMIAAGYSEETARSPKRELLGTPGAQSYLEQYREEYVRQGIVPTYYIRKVKDLMDAEKVHSSHTEPDRTVPDWMARAKGLEIYRKDIGLDIEPTGPQINIGTVNVTWEDGKL